jgi:hypothetical protein
MRAEKGISMNLLAREIQFVRESEARVRAARAEVNEPVYDFYRCVACHRLMTKLEEFRIFDPSSTRFGQPCPCGSRRYSPANLLWYEWLLPRVVKFALFRIWRVA